MYICKLNRIVDNGRKITQNITQEKLILYVSQINSNKQGNIFRIPKIGLTNDYMYTIGYIELCVTLGGV